MASAAEADAMRRAIALAAAARGRTNPNPAVGAVVLDAANTVVGEGSTERAGGAHAEVVALRAAGESARDATLVVTLEPCAHTGRTGPCTAAIAAAGIRRVVYAVADPNGPAAGGADVLRSAGVDVEPGALSDEAGRDLEPWLTAVRRGRAYVTWKYAATLDGRTAAADGTSRWITGTAARADVHRLRLLNDAVVVGVGTVLADDPALTVRHCPAPRQPVRVVVDTQARTPLTAAVVDGSAATVVAVGEGAPADRVAALRGTGAEVAELPVRNRHVDLPALLSELHRRELLQVLVEGGATLAAAFVRAALVDRVVGYHAPALLGAGTPLLGDVGIGTIDQALRLDVVDVSQVGADVRITTSTRTEGP